MHQGKGVQLCLSLRLARFVVPEHSSFSLHHVKAMSSANAITVCRYSPLLLKCWCCKMVEVDAVTKEVTRTWKLAGEWNCQLSWQLNFTTWRHMVRTSVPYDCNMPVILHPFSCPSLSFRSMPILCPDLGFIRCLCMKKLSSKLVSASDHICISATLNTPGIDKRLWTWELEHVREVLVMLLLPSTMILIETPWFHPDCRGGSELWASVNMLGCQSCIPIGPSPRWTGYCKRKQTV